MTLPPALLFPTTTLLLDDDDDFLSLIQKALNKEKTLIKTFTSSINALEFLDKNNHISLWGKSWLKTFPSEDNFDNLKIEIQLPKIFQVLLDQNRFYAITTIIVDYQMPENGIDFLKKISNLSIKKILLTGIADADTAIEAMELGLIDSYIKKHDKNIISKLNKTILQHRIDYFSSLTSTIIESINLIYKNNELINNYCHVIDDIISRFNAVEYYLMDQNGSYTFLNKNGNKLDLLIKTKEQLEAEFDDIKDNIKDTDTIDKLKKHELMMINHNKLVMLPTHIIHQKYGIYYSISDKIFNIDLAGVTPFGFLAQNFS